MNLKKIMLKHAHITLLVCVCLREIKGFNMSFYGVNEAEDFHIMNV